jgi:hypothetical protein
VVRISLSLEQFQTLVSGGIVTDGETQIALQDVGFDQMVYAIEFAREGGKQSLNQRRVVAGMYHCTCGNAVSAARVSDAVGNITCPSCGIVTGGLL